MKFKSYEDFMKYKNESSINYSNYNIKELLKLPTFSGIYNLSFEGKNFDYINIGNDDGGILKFFWQGEPEFISMKIWTTLINKNNIALDIGANTGRYSVIGGKFGGDVISFEPYNINFCRLVDNLKLNNLNYLNTLMAGLSEEDRNGFLSVNSPLFYKSAGGKISQSGINIRLLKLDNINFNKPINILKIDVEGHELEVLNGSLKKINDFLPYILIEYNLKNFNKILELLRTKFNYDFLLINDLEKKVIKKENINSKLSFDGNILFFQNLNDLKLKNIIENYS